MSKKIVDIGVRRWYRYGNAIEGRLVIWYPDFAFLSNI